MNTTRLFTWAAPEPPASIIPFAGAYGAHQADSEEPAPAEPSRPLPVSTIIADKYVLHGVLGRGAFGIVYEAEHLDLARKVAIKIYHSDDDVARAFLPRVQREARLSALVRHANVIEVYDTGRLEDGLPYLVMELIQGETLASRLARGPLSIAAVVDLGCQLLCALEALADLDMVHRDIKPENLMLQVSPSRDVERLKLVDFGICKQLVGQHSGSTTRAGAMVGTPQYMSPEQMNGEPADHRSDLYAVAAVLYEATTGRVPHPGECLADQVIATLQDALISPRKLRPECPSRLARLLMRALAHEPTRRPQSARVMREELEGLGSELGLPRGVRAWREEGPSEADLFMSGISYRHRLRRLAVGAIAAAVPLVALGSWGMHIDTQTGPARNAVASASAPSKREQPRQARGQIAAPEAIEPSPQGARDISSLSWPVLMRRARVSYKRGDYQTAQRLYEQATRKEPQRVEGWRGLALTTAHRYRGDDAKIALQQ